MFKTYAYKNGSVTESTFDSLQTATDRAEFELKDGATDVEIWNYTRDGWVCLANLKR